MDPGFRRDDREEGGTGPRVNLGAKYKKVQYVLGTDAATKMLDSRGKGA